MRFLYVTKINRQQMSVVNLVRKKKTKQSYLGYNDSQDKSKKHPWTLCANSFSVQWYVKVRCCRQQDFVLSWGILLSKMLLINLKLLLTLPPTVSWWLPSFKQAKLLLRVMSHWVRQKGQEETPLNCCLVIMSQHSEPLLKSLLNTALSGVDHCLKRH